MLASHNKSIKNESFPSPTANVAQNIIDSEWGKITPNNRLYNELKFAKKMYVCAQLLGAQSDLLSTISSWRQEIDDEETFASLDAWIDATVTEQQESLDHITKWHKK